MVSSSSSWCLEYAALLYCGTPWPVHIIILLSFSPVWNSYPKGSRTTGATKRPLNVMIELKIEFATNKCLNTIRFTEAIPIA